MDSDLLDGLDDLACKPSKEEEKPKGTFIFGRTKTPELRSSRSLSRINSKCDETDSSVLLDLAFGGTKKSQPKVSQSTVFTGVLREDR